MLQRLKVHAHDGSQQKITCLGCGEVAQRTHDAHKKSRASQPGIARSSTGQHERGIIILRGNKSTFQRFGEDCMMGQHVEELTGNRGHAPPQAAVAAH